MLRLEKKSVYMPPVHADYRFLHGFVKTPAAAGQRREKIPQNLRSELGDIGSPRDRLASVARHLS
ncbi:protein of unknown function [Hyphomicrobium sp. MC1]|nr:protein of unknown function [Hyphomicrobium sp. MC1]